jgi:DNA-binding XRE family transcriptional regulator
MNVYSDWNEGGCLVESSEKDYGDLQLASRILRIRSETGLSMEAFASLMGVSQPTQSRIERAKRLPDALYLRALHERFRVDINKLLMGMDDFVQSAGDGGVQINIKGNVGGDVAGRDIKKRAQK